MDTPNKRNSNPKTPHVSPAVQSPLMGLPTQWAQDTELRLDKGPWLWTQDLVQHFRTSCPSLSGRALHRPSGSFLQGQEALADLRLSRFGSMTKLSLGSAKAERWGAGAGAASRRRLQS